MRLPAQCAQRRARHEAEHGAILIEFTLTVTVLVLLFLGAWQFGYAFYLYAELDQAVRAGARYAALRTYDSANETPTAAFQSAVQNVVVYGDPAGGANAIVPGLTTGNVSLTVTFSHAAPASVAVAVTNFQVSALFTAVTLSNKPVSQFPYMGTFGPP